MEIPSQNRRKIIVQQILTKGFIYLDEFGF